MTENQFVKTLQGQILYQSGYTFSTRELRSMLKGMGATLAQTMGTGEKVHVPSIGFYHAYATVPRAHFDVTKQCVVPGKRKLKIDFKPLPLVREDVMKVGAIEIDE